MRSLLVLLASGCVWGANVSSEGELGRTADFLYCRCGLDHSDPYADNADTACKTVQYDENAEGITGSVPLFEACPLIKKTLVGTIVRKFSPLNIIL